MTTSPSAGERLYSRVAGRIEALIQNGTLRPGDRVPSVRRLSRQQGVSVPTTLHAYMTLENRGWIEARPKSGYFVRARLSAALPEPRASAFASLTVRESKQLGVVHSLMTDIINPAVVPLGAAIPSPDYLPGEKLARTMGAIARTLGSKSVAYDPAPGSELLRRELSRRSLQWGCALQSSDFIITNGATEALSIALRNVCRPGDSVAVESPVYFGLLGILRELNLKPLPVASRASGGLDLETLEKTIRAQKVAACVVISNFSNPSGGSLPRPDKKHLVSLLARRNIPLIEDDIYGDLQHEGERPPCAKAYDTDGNVLLCGSFSKTLAPGYRTGYLVPGAHFAAALRLKSNTSLCNSTLPTLAVAEFLKNGGYDHHLRTLRAVFRQNVQRMREAIAAAFPPGVAVSRPEGGFVLWLELPRKVDSLRLFHEARARGVSIAPGPLFSADLAFRNFIRLNSGFPWSPRLAEAIETLGLLVRGQLG